MKKYLNLYTGLTVQSQFGGTGLGLTISDQILGLGSKLDLKSKFGEVFFLYS
jgi:signal transduction histidine kinase